jgi:catalase
VQLAAADDSIADARKVWPDSRPTVELGEIAIIKALDTKKVENELLFLPTNVTSGIDPSDDPIIDTRTEAYAEPNRSPRATSLLAGNDEMTE